MLEQTSRYQPFGRDDGIRTLEARTDAMRQLAPTREAELLEVKAALVESRANCDSLQEAQAVLLASTSWRMTAPLRWLATRTGLFRGGGAMVLSSILRISVVVCTYNRAQVVKNAVAGLLQQVHPSTEIIVVNGPSTDDTLDALTAFGSKIKIINCPTSNVSRARNIGIEASHGDVVAFIDDDAVPASNWLSELASVYSETEASGAGGPVFNEGAITEPWQICTCTRTGDVNVNSKPPISQYMSAGADPFMYLAGCNMSFRRSALIDAGGFNEELEYGYDDVEICRVLVNSGHTLVWSPKVTVHHRPAASGLRDSKGIIRDISRFVRSQAIFALQDPHAIQRL